MLSRHATTLYVRPVLKQADHKADHRKPANSAIDRLIAAAHGEEVLYQGDQDGHRRILLLPGEKGIDSRDPSKVLERDVNLQPSTALDELDQRDLGMPNYLSVAGSGHSALDEQVLKCIKHPVIRVLGLPTLIVHSIRAEDEIDVSGRQVEARRERAKGIDLCVAEEVSAEPLELLNKLPANVLLEVLRLDMVVKIEDLFMQPRRRVSSSGGESPSGRRTSSQR